MVKLVGQLASISRSVGYMAKHRHRSGKDQAQMLSLKQHLGAKWGETLLKFVHRTIVEEASMQFLRTFQETCLLATSGINSRLP